MEDIDAEIAEINEKQHALVCLMTTAATKLSNDLNQSVTSDVKKYLRELGKLIEIYDSNAAVKTELLYKIENNSMFHQYKYIKQ